MENVVDASTATREQQLTMIVQQQTVIQEMQRRVAALEEQLRHSGGDSAMPGTKPGAEGATKTTAPRVRSAAHDPDRDNGSRR